MKFKTGQIWISPRGIYHRVVDTSDFQATMRKGMDGSGRKSFRKIDVPAGWLLRGFQASVPINKL